MTNILEIRLIRNDDEFRAILDVRNRVFVKEQNVPQIIEFDGFDEESVHDLVKLDKKTIGCARIRASDGKMKLERIAILKEYRNQGLGQKLIQYSIAYCKARNASEIIIHAQYHLKRFYEKLGFNTRGKEFYEAGIKHIEMFIKSKK